VATVSRKQKQVEEFVELIQIQITAGADHFIAAVAGAVFGHGHFSYCQVAAKKRCLINKLGLTTPRLN
jgi:hypothetical protein